MEYSIFLGFEYKGIEIDHYSFDEPGKRIQLIWRGERGYTACTIGKWGGSPQEVAQLQKFLISQFEITRAVRALSGLKSGQATNSSL